MRCALGGAQRLIVFQTWLACDLQTGELVLHLIAAL
jgi:hypothetical protein